MRNQLGLLRVGSKVELDVVRDGRRLALAARLADPYENFVKGRSVAAQFDGALLGDTVDESALGRLEAVVVGRVEPESAAWEMGLREGDAILEANKQRLKNVEQLRKIARGSEGLYMLRLRRGNQLLLVMARR
jgi:membrane-associated protease RseP (regulator of RpoE activity)